MDANKAFIENFDKLAIGIAGLALVMALGGSLLGESPAEAQKAKVDRFNNDIGKKRRAASAEISKLMQDAPPRTESAALKRGLSSPPLPEAWKSWLFHKRPMVVLKIIGVDIPDPAHLPPTNFQGSPGLGRISLSWEESGDNRLVTVAAYRVMRRAGDSDEWQTVQELDGAAHSFVDKQAEPRKEYWYKVESTAEIDRSHKVVKRYKIELPAEQEVTVTTEIGPYATRRDQYPRVITVRAQTYEEKLEGIVVKEKAYMKVYKFFVEQDAWVESRQLIVPVGEAIGETQRLKHGGERVKFDFTTPYVLMKVKVKQIKKTVPDPDGGPPQVFKVDAHIAVLKDTSTGETFEINSVVLDPGLASVIEEIKGGRVDDGEDPDDDDGDKPK